MTNKVKRQRFSKDEWLEAGLRMLAEHGVEKLTIGSLSRTVGVAKTSFYWHFKDRQDLLDHMLEYWVTEFNNVVTNNPQLLELEPRQRLQAVVDAIIEQELVKYELAIRGWASHDGSAKEVYDTIYNRRMVVLRRVFADAGFDEEQQEARAQTFNCYLTWGQVMQDNAQSFKMTVDTLLSLLLRKESNPVVLE